MPAPLAQVVARRRGHRTARRDHGVSEAIYFRDPDDNGIEIYRDRPEADWPRDGAGQLKMVNDPLDLNALLAEA